jgi:hypothetical protein
MEINHLLFKTNRSLVAGRHKWRNAAQLSAERLSFAMCGGSCSTLVRRPSRGRLAALNPGSWTNNPESGG